MYCQLFVLFLFSVQIYCFKPEKYVLTEDTGTAGMQHRIRYPKIGPLFSADVNNRQGRIFLSDTIKSKSTKSQNGRLVSKSDSLHESVTTGSKRSPRSVVLNKENDTTFTDPPGTRSVEQSDDSIKNSPADNIGSFEKLGNENPQSGYSQDIVNLQKFDEGLVNMIKDTFLTGKSLHEAYDTYVTDIRLKSPGVSMERSRKKRGGHLLKRLALPLLLALKMKTALILPVIFGIVTLIAFKGLWAGLTALGISAALGLKALISSSNKVLYEVRSPPPHFHHGPVEYSEYWNRRGNEPSSGWR